MWNIRFVKRLKLQWSMKTCMLEVQLANERHNLKGSQFQKSKPYDFMDLLRPWSLSRSSTTSLNARITCIKQTSSGISSKAIVAEAEKEGRKGVFLENNIESKDCVKRLRKVIVASTTVLPHYKVASFRMKALLTFALQIHLRFT